MATEITGPDPCTSSCIFINIYVKSNSRYSPVHVLSETFPIDPTKRGNRDPPSATTETTLPEKTQDFAPESVF